MNIDEATAHLFDCYISSLLKKRDASSTGQKWKSRHAEGVTQAQSPAHESYLQQQDKCPRSPENVGVGRWVDEFCLPLQVHFFSIRMKRRAPWRKGVKFKLRLRASHRWKVNDKVHHVPFVCPVGELEDFHCYVCLLERTPISKLHNNKKTSNLYSK